jgi:hypothetical protein
LFELAAARNHTLLPLVTIIAYDHTKEDWRKKNITPRMTPRAPIIPAYGMTWGTGLLFELDGKSGYVISKIDGETKTSLPKILDTTILAYIKKNKGGRAIAKAARVRARVK